MVADRRRYAIVGGGHDSPAAARGRDSMNRRDFVSAALTGGGALLASATDATATAPAQDARVDYYELRRYLLRRGPQTELMNAYLSRALLPAAERAGVGPIGVFSVMAGPESPSLYVLITHKTLDGFATLPGRLAADAEYQTAAADFLAVPATGPAYVRMETSLLRAFETLPHVQLPFGGGEAGRRARIFELRTYESHSERAGKKKIEMFNTGEIAIFRRAGLTPVFFGETLVGAGMPNLTYMLVYEDMAAHDRQWAAFSSDPDWRKLSTTPGFTDPEIVSNITNYFLRPTGYSQI
jgi:NIPSNAP